MQSSFHTSLKVSGTINAQTCMDGSRTFYTFGDIDELSIAVLLGAKFIEILIKSFHMGGWKIVPDNFPPVPAVMVQNIRSKTEKNRPNRSQEKGDKTGTAGDAHYKEEKLYSSCPTSRLKSHVWGSCVNFHTSSWLDRNSSSWKCREESGLHDGKGSKNVSSGRSLYYFTAELGRVDVKEARQEKLSLSQIIHRKTSY